MLYLDVASANMALEAQARIRLQNLRILRRAPAVAVLSERLARHDALPLSWPLV
jgi:hypothetical protein